ncbi:hypothetical protein D9619_007746 [Psilocybe cf. subviscida]|uniref:F-box domain-containing protein n=1 Tax=Psilocybe cf. subviscida TaxID=2480587 RepID=A0A8H5ESC4_9AGAR|nr:hypothetical protein D9619_007746 [Psilocybe cf. subviscida]
MSPGQGPSREPELPPELIDSVLELLVAEWYSIPYAKRRDHEIRLAVSRCMVVSRAFLTSTRRCLFAHVSTHERPKASSITPLAFSNEDVTARMDSLLKLLRNDPLQDTQPLAGHIRSIEVEMDPLSHKNTDRMRQENLHRWLKQDSGTLDWNARRINMREVLRLLPNLHTFSLIFTSPISAYALHVGLSLAVEKLCRSALLTSLRFENINNFPVDMLASCPNLADLQLVNVHARDAAGDPTSPFAGKYMMTLLPSSWDRQSLRRLRNLTTENSGDVYEAIKANAKQLPLFSSLKALDISVYAYAAPENPGDTHILRAAAPRLESLSIRGIGFDSSCNKFPHIALGKFQALRTLHIKASPLSNLFFRNVPRGLNVFLASDPDASAAIETLVFEFTTVPVIASDIGAFDVDHAWAVVDEHLVDQRLYPYLKLVRFQLSYLYRRRFGMAFETDNSNTPDMDWVTKGLASLSELASKVFPKVAHCERIKYDVCVDLTETQN